MPLAPGLQNTGGLLTFPPPDDDDMMADIMQTEREIEDEYNLQVEHHNQSSNQLHHGVTHRPDAPASLFGPSQRFQYPTSECQWTDGDNLTYANDFPTDDNGLSTDAERPTAINATKTDNRSRHSHTTASRLCGPEDHPITSSKPDHPTSPTPPVHKRFSTLDQTYGNNRPNMPEQRVIDILDRLVKEQETAKAPEGSSWSTIISTIVTIVSFILSLVSTFQKRMRKAKWLQWLARLLAWKNMYSEVKTLNDKVQALENKVEYYKVGDILQGLSSAGNDIEELDTKVGNYDVPAIKRDLEAALRTISAHWIPASAKQRARP
ncbi:hypothetical protein LZ32DRAFT_675793 [Colletotrichum eremochloae]|nr:hypothetical protein LZ32DRAFT_675793 [Colletotrichum eremochloae]